MSQTTVGMLTQCQVRIFHKRFLNLKQSRLITEPAMCKHQTSCEIEENCYQNLSFVSQAYGEDARLTYITLTLGAHGGAVG